MDLSQIRKRVTAADDADLRPRWARVDEALAAGVALKQRVIEELRPTLLDNMGLFSALRWLASQRAEQAGMELLMEGLDEDFELEAHTAIAVFRTAQEAMANVVKHAQATKLTIRALRGQNLEISIEDNGTGLPADAGRRTGSHGLKQMRFRMHAVGGRLTVENNRPTGTIVRLSVPLKDARENA